MRTRQRELTAPLPRYLVSRSRAGATHDDLIRGAETASRGLVEGRFFHFFPRRRVSTLEWLAKWVKLGAVPLVTLNNQVAVPDGHIIPDAWHHQMIYGVSPDGVFATNPLGVIPMRTFEEQICSESVLLIRRNDVLMRYSDFKDMELISEGRWAELNVLEQIDRIVNDKSGSQTHILIPASYSSGVSLFAKVESTVWSLLGEEVQHEILLK